MLLVGAIARAARTAARSLGPLYGAGLLAASWGAAASAVMFVAQMAFFNRVSDPKIGGTYMTMLNTISNLGGQWPGTFVLATKAKLEEHFPEANSFYGVTSCALVLGAAWLFFMQRRVLALQALPAKSWLASS